MGYQINDKVNAKGIAFWLTIKAISPSGWITCNFGATERYAGRFRASELSIYTNAY